MDCRLAVAQTAATSSCEENFSTLVGLAQKAKQRDCQALCLPEAFLTGYCPHRVEEQHLTREAALLEQVAQLARQESLDLLVGLQERAGEEYYLTQGLFLADGRREFYRKTHLGQREAQVFTPGRELPVFQLTNGLWVGIALCVECHFPELLQTLALKGAEVVFAPHAVPVQAGFREKIWSRYIPARSYDNRLYMACCNLEDGNGLAGGCLVTTPTGEELCSYYGQGEHLLCFTVERELVEAYRENRSMGKRFYPAFRQQELYE